MWHCVPCFADEAGEEWTMSASVDEQVEWARASALVVMAPERCVLEVTGADRLSWLNGLLTCQLASRTVGEAVHGLAVAQKGKIVTDVVVVIAKDRALVVVQRATVEALVASFEHHLMMEDAEMKPVPLDVCFAHGPRAAEVLVGAVEGGAVGGPFDATGLGGAVILTAAGDDSALAVQRAAERAGGGVGDDAGWDAVRVAAGVAKFGVDFDDATYPQEAALETKAVSFDKGCYLGQEVVCMLEMRGHVKRKLVSLALDGAPGAPMPAAHTGVDDGKGTAIGEVTSVVRLRDGETRALAMLKYAFIGKGTEVRVGDRTARVL